LKARSDGGAGLAELLEYLKMANRRFGPLRRLSDAQFDELALYCWTLQKVNPTGLLWGRARELWGPDRITASRGGQSTRRRPERRVKR
jgi:hypothetical protein